MEEEVEVAKKRCKGVIERIGRLPNITHSTTRTLLKLAHSELCFLSRFSSSSSHRFRFNVNIGHLEAVVHILQHPFITGVSRVCKRLPLLSVHVDIVCTLNKNPVWIIVSDRNPKYVTWLGIHKHKGLQFRIQQLLASARSSHTLKPSSILLFFSNGLPNFVRHNLVHEFGASDFGLDFSVFDFDFSEELEGEWINVLARSFREACVLQIKVDDCSDISVLTFKLMDVVVPELRQECAQVNSADALCSLLSRMNFSSMSVNNVEMVKDLLAEADIINFDTTALIALISGISNGGTEKLLATPETELRRRFKCNFEFVMGQVMSEIQNPMLLELGGVIPGNRGIICETACGEFKELVLMCGGPNEKLRAEKLLKCLTVVPDSPSERMMGIPTTRKLALKNKIVFGTGDYWHAPTVTANMSFVRAVSQTGMSLFTIEHRPRALTGD